MTDTALAPTKASHRARRMGRQVLLESIGASRREADAAEARTMVAVTEWADLHRADADADRLVDPDDAWTLTAQSAPVMMSGVPIDEYCLAELAAALRVSAGSCRGLVEESLEVRERLPLLWDRVLEVRVPAWKARALARRTRSLTDDAASWVDRQVAPFAHSMSVGRLLAMVDAAVKKFDPDRAAAEAATVGDGRGVWVDHTPEQVDGAVLECGPTGFTRIEALVSVPDALAFDAAVSQVAGDLAALGDEAPLQVRRSKAVGVLADPQYALDVSATAEATAEAADDEAGSAEDGDRRPNRAPTPFATHRPVQIHLHTATEVARVQATGLPHAASPVSETAIRTWLAEVAPGARVSVTPVIDLNLHHASDAYEAPARVRTTVELRDHSCVFPYCTRRARFDLDHIEPYLDPDEGGPPGQTSSHNLAKLCRYHHRVKTHSAWTYRRVTEETDLHDAGADAWVELRYDEAVDGLSAPVAAYVWTSPMGHRYLVDGTGTHPLDAR